MAREHTISASELKANQWKYMKKMNKHHNKQVQVWRQNEWLAHKHDKAHMRVIVDRPLWARRQHRETFGQ